VLAGTEDQRSKFRLVKWVWSSREDSGCSIDVLINDEYFPVYHFDLLKLSFIHLFSGTFAIFCFLLRTLTFVCARDTFILYSYAVVIAKYKILNPLELVENDAIGGAHSLFLPRLFDPKQRV
jgi:hypothetical protein